MPQRDPAPAERDPLARVLALGQRQVRTGTAIGIAGGLLVHIALAGHAQSVSQLVQVRAFAAVVRADIRSRVHVTFDIEREEEKPPEPEPPPPEPPPPGPEEPKSTPEPKPAAEPNEPPPPPPAAEAAKVVAMDADPNAPLDLTGFTIVTGNAERSPGGLTASSGTSKRPVFDRAARPTGTGESKPVVAAKPVAAPAVDLSRPPQVAGSTGWSCPWPAEADIEQTNYWRVPLLLTIGADGRVTNVTVLGNDGVGFGAKARACALRQRFAPALDKAGKTVTGTIRVNVKFTR
jgi:protein TonB